MPELCELGAPGASITPAMLHFLRVLHCLQHYHFLGGGCDTRRACRWHVSFVGFWAHRPDTRSILYVHVFVAYLRGFRGSPWSLPHLACLVPMQAGSGCSIAPGYVYGFLPVVSWVLPCLFPAGGLRLPSLFCFSLAQARHDERCSSRGCPCTSCTCPRR